MTTSVRFLLDEHVGRLFEHVLRQRGYQVEQAKDRFGEHTDDADLLRWCAENGVLFVTNNAKDFEPLHQRKDHAGIFLYREQRLPDDDPEGVAGTVDEVLDQYGVDEVANELVDLDEWYAWLHQ